MKTQKQTINEMIAQIIAEARKLGYSEATIWRNITPKFQTVAVYYEKRGVCFYDPAITRELVDLQKERLDREEISIHYYKRVKSAANRLDEFYLTGTLHLNMPKHGTKYPISEDSEKLIDLFLDYKGYGPNTRDDVVWVVRRYLHYFESLGYASLEWVTVLVGIQQVRQLLQTTPDTCPHAAAVNSLDLGNLCHRHTQVEPGVNASGLDGGQLHQCSIHFFPQLFLLHDFLWGKWPGKGIVFNAILPVQRIMSLVPEFPALIGCIGLLLALDYCQHFFSHIHKGIGFIYIRIQVPKIDLLHYVPPFRFTG